MQGNKITIKHRILTNPRLIIIPLLLFTFVATSTSSFTKLLVNSPTFSVERDKSMGVAVTTDIQNLFFSTPVNFNLIKTQEASNSSFIEFTLTPIDAIVMEDNIAEEKSIVSIYTAYHQIINWRNLTVIPSLFAEKNDNTVIGGVDIDLELNFKEYSKLLFKLMNVATASSSYKLPFAFRVGLNGVYRTINFTTGVGRDEDDTWYPLFSVKIPIKNSLLEITSLDKSIKTLFNIGEYTFGFSLTEEDVEFLLKKKL